MSSVEEAIGTSERLRRRAELRLVETEVHT